MRGFGNEQAGNGRIVTPPYPFGIDVDSQSAQMRGLAFSMYSDC